VEEGLERLHDGSRVHVYLVFVVFWYWQVSVHRLPLLSTVRLARKRNMTYSSSLPKRCIATQLNPGFARQIAVWREVACIVTPSCRSSFLVLSLLVPNIAHHVPKFEMKVSSLSGKGKVLHTLSVTKDCILRFTHFLPIPIPVPRTGTR
jgi:hypothetical protein